MHLPRYIGIVDLGIATVVIATVLIPARTMYAHSSLKDETKQFGLALAEARTIAQPTDGGAVSDLARRLGDVAYKDWAIETAVRGAERSKGSPNEWRALMAASTAHVDKLDVVAALDYANRALTACQAVADACPSWEEIRMKLYQQHLDAGVKSGIDPRRDPKGFRAAGEAGLRSIRLNSNESESSSVPKGSGTGSPPAP
ncbi:MAG: hypothetical protein H0T46_34170 [Deltaproteobacteria bacterium]|nr:hypothetical protein [Deltaproteobacteria bacterium]